MIRREEMAIAESSKVEVSLSGLESESEKVSSVSRMKVVPGEIVDFGDVVVDSMYLSVSKIFAFVSRKEADLWVVADFENVVDEDSRYLSVSEEVAFVSRKKVVFRSSSS